MTIRAHSIQVRVPGWGSCSGQLPGGLCVLHGLSIAGIPPVEPVAPAALARTVPGATTNPVPQGKGTGPVITSVAGADPGPGGLPADTSVLQTLAPMVAEGAVVTQSVQPAALLGMADFPQLDEGTLLAEQYPVPAAGQAAVEDVLPQLGGPPATRPDSWRTRLARRVLRLGQQQVNMSPQRLAAMLRNIRDSESLSGTLQQNLQARGVHLQEQLLRALIDAGVDELQRNKGTWLRNLELRYQLPMHGRQEMLGMNAMFALVDSPGYALFSQAGLTLQGGKEDAYNLGLGYRSVHSELMLGANLFYDYLSDPGLQRFSMGLEAKTRLLDLYANWYQAITGAVPVSATQATYTPDGWDVELAGRIPQLPWVDVSAKYYRWDLLGGDKDLTGQRYSMRLQPVPLLSMEALYDSPENGSADWSIETRLKYRFGVPLREQLRFARVRTHRPSFRRFEQVRREYEQRTFQIQRPVPPINEVQVDLTESRLANAGLPLAANEVFEQEIPVELVLQRQVPGATGLQMDSGDQYPEVMVRLELTGTARFGDDYTVPSLVSLHRIAAGVQEGSPAELAGRVFEVAFPAEVVELRLLLVLRVINDADFELAESVDLQILSGTGYRVGSVDALSLLEILDDEGGGGRATTIVQFAVAGASAREGEAVSVSLSVSPPSNAMIQVPLTITGAAEAGVDYSATALGFSGIAPNLQLNIPANTTEAMFNLRLLNDDLQEGTEISRWTLGANSGFEPGAQDAWVLQLVDDDVSPDVRVVSFLAAASEIIEDSVTPASTGLDIQPPLAATESLQLDVRIAGTAGPGDYVLSSLTLSGLPPYAITVQPVDNALSEADKTLHLTLHTISGSYLAGVPAVHTLSIRNDDTLYIGFSSPELRVNEGASVTLQILVGSQVASPLRVPVAVVGTAVEGVDYTLRQVGGGGATLEGSGASLTLVIPPGTAAVNLALSALADNVVDPGGAVEYVVFRILPGVGYAITLDRLRIAIRDSSGQVGFSSDGGTVTEGDFASVLVSMVPPPTVATTVDMHLGGTAILNTHYVISPVPEDGVIRLGFAPGGSTAANIAIRTLDDDVGNGIRDVTLSLAPPVGVELGIATYQLFIEDDEVTRTVRFGFPGITVSEGDERRMLDEVEVNIAPGLEVAEEPLILPFIVDTVGSTAVRGRDYEFGVGVTEQGAELRITVIGTADTDTEDSVRIPIELLGNTNPSTISALTLRLVLQQGPQDYLLGAQRDFVLTITEDDQPVLRFAEAARTVAEDVGTAVPLNLLIDPPGIADLTATFEVSGVAVEGRDYQLLGLSQGAGATQRTLSIPAGTRQIPIMIMPLDNDRPDLTRELRLTLIEPVAGYFVDVPATFTLSITEQAVQDPYQLSFASGATSNLEGDSGIDRRQDVTISINPPLPASARLGLRLQFLGSATVMGDYDLPMLLSLESENIYGLEIGGTTSLSEYTISIIILGDLDSEPDERIELTLLPSGGEAGHSGYTAVMPRTWTYTIVDQDLPEVRFAQGGQMQLEADTMVELTVRATPPSYRSFGVPISVSGRAERGMDYALAGTDINGSLQFSAGQTEATLQITLLNDQLLEGGEDIRLELPAARDRYRRVIPYIFVLNIDDDDLPTLSRTVRFSTPGETTTEGDSSRQQAVSLRFSPPLLDTDATVAVALRTGGNAIQGTACVGATDYVLSAPGLSGVAPLHTLLVSGQPAPGLASVDLQLEICGDTEDEADEFIVLSVQPSSGGEYSLVSPLSYTLTLQDNDSVSVAFETAAVTAAEGNLQQVTLVSTTSAPAEGLTVQLQVATSTTTAVLGTDYSFQGLTDGASAGSYTLSIPSGQTRASFQVVVLDDGEDDPNERLVLQILADTAYQPGPTPTWTLDIVSENISTVSFAVASASISENNESVTVIVQAVPPPSTPLQIPIVLESGSTAVLIQDYTLNGLTGVISPYMVTLPNSGSASFTITGIDDAQGEGSKLVLLSLQADTNVDAPAWQLGSSPTYQLTITDDDVAEGVRRVGFATASSQAAESVGTHTVMVTVAPALAAGDSLMVAFQAGGTADRADYSFGTGVTGTAPDYTLALSGAGGSFTLPIMVAADMMDEPDETVALTLAAGADYVPEGIIAHTLSIEDDDDPAAMIAGLSVLPALVSEGGLVEVEVELSTPAPAELPIQYQLTANGSTLTAADVQVDGEPGQLNANLMVTIQANQNRARIQLRLVDDAVSDPGESLQLVLQAGVGYTLGPATTYTLTVEDNDLPTVSFSVGSGILGEAGGTVTVTVQSTPPPAAALVIPVTLDVDSSTALAADYMLGSLGGSDPAYNIAVPTSGSVEFTITGVDDGTAEGSERVVFTLGEDSREPPAWTLGAERTYTLQITDDDVAESTRRVSFAAPSSQAVESVSARTVMVTVTPELEAADSLMVVFRAAGTADGSADYSFGTGVTGTAPQYMLEISGPGGSFTLPITVTTDTMDEPDETVALTLVAGADYVPDGVITHILTIADDDDPAATIAGLSLLPAMVSEGGLVDIEVELSTPAPAELPIHYQLTANGSGLTAADVQVGGGAGQLNTDLMVTIQANQDRARIQLRLVDDAVSDPGESLQLVLQAGVGYTLGPATTYTLMVEDNDLPTVSFSMGSGILGEAGGMVTVTVQSVPSPAMALTIPVILDTGSSTALAADYMLGSLGGSDPTYNVAVPTSGSVTFTITGVDDGTAEGSERVVFTLGEDSREPPAWTLGAERTYTLQITDDDVAESTRRVSFAAPSSQAVESVSARTVMVTVTPELEAADSLMVVFRAAGTADNADYSFGTGVTGTAPDYTLAISGPGGSFTLPITVTTDTMDEPDETVALTLVAGADYVPDGVITHILTIADDDDPAATIAGLSLLPAMVSEGGLVDIEVELSTPAPAELPIHYQLTANGSGLTAADVQVGGGAGQLNTDLMVTIQANQDRARIQLRLVDDAVSDPGESLQLVLQAGVGYTLGPATTYTLMVEDNDLPTVSFSMGSGTLGEAGGVVTVTVQSVPSPAMALTIPVMLDTSSSTATLTADYTLSGLGGSDPTYDVTLPVSGSVEFTITGVDDGTAEGSERVVFALEEDSGLSPAWTLGARSTYTLQITDDDVAESTRRVSFAAPSSQAVESVSARQVMVTVTPELEAADSLMVVFRAAGTADGSADYSFGTGVTGTAPQYMLEISGPGGSFTLPITVTTDTMDEPDETVALTLVAGADYVPDGVITHILTIADDDDPAATIAGLSLLPAMVSEGGLVDIEVELSTPAPAELPIHYQLTANGSGLTAADVQVGGGAGQLNTDLMVTIQANQDRARIQLRLVDDSVSDPGESLQLVLQAGVGYTLGPATTYTLMVEDNDLPTVSFSVGSGILGEAGGMVTVTVQSVPSPAMALTIPVILDTGSSTALAADYMLGSLGGSDPTYNVAVPTSGSVTFTITGVDDGTAEGSERVVFTLGEDSRAPPAWTLGAERTYTLQITDDDVAESTRRVSFAAPSSQAVESVSARTVMVTVTPELEAADSLMVVFRAAGTADGSADYSFGTGVTGTAPQYMLEISGPGGSFTLPITVTTDTMDEPDETVALTLVAGADYVPDGVITHILTIADDDDPAATIAGLSLLPAMVSEGGLVDIEVELSTPAPAELPIHYQLTANGSGLTAADVQVGGGAGQLNTDLMVTIQANQDRARIQLRLVDDAVSDPGESLQLVLQAGVGYTLGPATTYTLMVEDNDLPTVSFSMGSGTLGEAGGVVTVTVQSVPSPAMALTIPVMLDTSSSTATLTADYTLSGLGGSDPTYDVTLPVSGSVEFTITGVDDSTAEGSERVVFALEEDSDLSPAWTLGAERTYTLQITDDDVEESTRRVSFAAALSQAAESVSARQVMVTVTPELEAADSLMVAFHVAGTADSADYSFGTGVTGTPPDYMLAISGPGGSFTLPITVTTDTMDEPDETVALTLVAGADYVPDGVITHILTIADDDDPAATIAGLSLLPAMVSEGGLVDIEVELSTPAPAELPIQYQLTANGSGLTAADVQVGGGAGQLNTDLMVTIQANQDRARIQLRLVDDAVSDPGESLQLVLQAGVGYTLGPDTTYTLMVEDNDLPTVSFSMGSGTLGEAGGMVTVTVQSVPFPAAELTIPVMLEGSSTATLTADYTLSGLGGSDPRYNVTLPVSGSVAFTITGVDDSTAEGSERVVFTLGEDSSEPTAWTLGAERTYTLQITDDDVEASARRVSFAAALSQAAESVSARQVMVTVTPALEATDSLMVAFHVAGTADGSADYSFGTGVSGTASEYMLALSGAGGSFPLLITVTTDMMDEPDETVVLTLVSGADYVLEGELTHTLTIADDDPPVVEFVSASATLMEGELVQVELRTESGLAVSGAVQLRYQLSTTTVEDTDFSVVGGANLATPDGMVELLAGDATVVLELRARDDELDELQETLTLTLQAPSLGMPYLVSATANTFTLTITDTDVPTVQFEEASRSVNEGTMDAQTISVQVNPVAAATFMLPITVGGTATLTNDYTLAAIFSGTPPNYMLSVGAGASTLNFNVTIVNDSVADEGVETVVLSLGAADASVWTPGSDADFTLSIVDDETATITQTVSFAAENSTVMESAGTHTVDVTLATALLDSESLAIMFTLGGDAVLTTDYTLTTGTITGMDPYTLTLMGSASGVNTGTISLSINDDTVDGPDVRVLLALQSTTGYVTGTTVQHVVTITDDDDPVVSFESASATAMEGDTVQVAVQTTTPASSGGLAVDYALVGGTGLDDSDFNFVAGTGTGSLTAGIGTITIPEGDTRGVIEIQLSSDAQDEIEETLTLTLTAVSDRYTTDTNDTFMLTLEDTTVPEVSFVSSASMVMEDGTPGMVTVNVSTALSMDLPITLMLSALPGMDYSLTGTGLSGSGTTRTLTIPASQSSATFSVTPRTNNAAPQGAVAVSFTLQSSTADYTVGSMNQHTVTINDDDYTVQFADAASMIAEGAGSTDTITVDVVPAVRAGATVVIAVQLAPTTGYTFGGNGVAGSGSRYTLTLIAGESQGALALTPVDNDVDAADQRVTLSLQSGSNYVTGSTTQHMVTITDDDDPVVSFESASAMAMEGDTVQVAVQTTTTASGSGLAVNYALAGGTGLEDSDFTFAVGTASLTAGTGTITIPGGRTSTNIEIQLSSDAQDEIDETLTLTLTAVSDRYTTDANDTFMLTLEDATVPEVSFAVSTSTVTEGDAASTVRVNVSPVSSTSLSVPVQLSAAPGTDYSLMGLTGSGTTRTLVILANQPSATFSVTPRTDNAAPQGAVAVSFTLQSSLADYAVGSRHQHTVTINDDDYTVQFAQPASSVAENAASAHNIIVQLTPRVRPGDMVAVALSGSPVSGYTLGGTGVAGSGSRYTLTLMAGESQGALALTPVDNDVDAADQRVTLSLQSGTNYITGSTAQHMVTIIDDDDPVVSFESASAMAMEGDTVQVAVQTTTTASGSGLAVNYALAGGTGLEDSDFTFAVGTASLTAGTGTGTITIPAGRTSTNIEIQLSSDAQDEIDETLTLTLTAVSDRYTTDANDTFMLTIEDATVPEVSFAVSTSTVTEGDAASTVRVDVSPVSSTNLSVPVQLSAAPGMDYSLTGTGLSGSGNPRTLTIPANQPSATFSVTPRTDNAAPQGAVAVSFTLQSSAADYAVGSRDRHTVTITDDDYTVQFAQPASSVAENAATEHNIIVQLTPGVRPGDMVAVALSGSPVSGYTLGGTGVTGSGSRYTLTLMAGESQGALALTPADNDVDAADQRVTLSLQSGTNYVAGSTAQHMVTITDDDDPVVSFESASAMAMEGDTIQVAVQTTTTASGGGLAVNYALAGGTGLDASDFTFAAGTASLTGGTGTGTITIPAGRTSTNIEIQLSSDAQDESDETLTLTLTAVSDRYAINTNNTFTLTIEDATVPEVSFAVSTSSVTEGDAASTVRVDVSPVSSTNLSVPVQLSAAPGTDYSLIGLTGITTTRTLVILANQSSATFSVTPRTNNAAPQGAVAVSFTLQSGSADYAVGSRHQHTVTINDDDYTVQFAAAASSVAENAATAHNIIVRVTPGVRAGATVVIAVQLAPPTGYTFGGTGVTGSGSRYTLTLQAGESQGALVLTPVDNDVDAADQRVTLSLQSGSNYVTGSTAQHMVTITDDDDPVVSFESASAMAMEGDTIQVAVQTTTTASGGGLAVNYALAGGTGLDASDFTFAAGTASLTGGTGTGTITIPAGRTSTNIEIQLSSDAQDESDETLTLTLTAVSDRYAINTNNTFTLTIEDATVPEVSFAVSTSSVTEGDAASTVRVEVSPVSSTNLSVPVQLSADPGTDYRLIGLTGITTTRTLMILANQPSATFSVTPRMGNAAPQGAVAVSFTLQSGSADYAVGSRNQHTVTINDDDYTVQFAAAASSVAENAATAHNIIVRVTPGVRAGATVVIAVQLAPPTGYTFGGTGVTGSGSRYTLTLMAGDSQGALVLTPVDNDVDAADQRVTLSLQSGSNYVTGSTAQHMVTITDDDDPVVSFESASAMAMEGDTVQVAVQTTTTASGGGLAVNYALAGGTGLDDRDFTFAAGTASLTGGTGTGTIMIPAGRTGTNIEIQLSSDALDERNETLTLTLTAVAGSYAINTNNTFTLTIEDVTVPEVSFAVSTSTVTEGAAASTVRVEVSPVSSTSLSVPVQLSAAPGTDYSLMGLTGSGNTRTLMILANQPSATFSVTPRADNNSPTGAVSVSFTLQPSPGYTVMTAARQHRLTINDDDYTVQFARPASSVAENAATAHNIIVQLTPRVRPGATVEVALSISRVSGYTLGGTGVHSGSRLGRYTLVLSAGANQSVLELTPIDNSADAGNVRFNMNLQMGTNYVLGSPLQHTVTIEDDDDPVVSFMSASTRVMEGRTVQVAVTSTTAAPSGGLLVNYRLTGGSGLTDADFMITGATLSGGGSVTIPRAATGVMIDVQPLSDTLDERDEILTLTLTAVAGRYAINTSNTFALTIEDATVPEVSFALSTSSVTEGGTPGTVTVRVDPPPASALSVNLRLSTTAAASDYSLTGLSGATGNTRTLTISANQRSATFTVVPRATDRNPVGDATVAFILQSGTGYAVGSTNRHTVTVNDDDYTVQFSRSASSVAEDADSPHSIVVSVDPAVRTGAPVAVALRVTPTNGYTLGGTGVSGSNGNYMLSLPARASQGTLRLTPTDNTVDGADLSVTLSLQAGSDHVTGRRAAHTVTIVDDEALLVQFTRVPPSQTVMEGGAAVNIAVGLSTNAPPGGLAVNYRLEGTAGLNPADFSIAGVTATGSGTRLAGTGTVQIRAGSSSANIPVSIRTDTTDEEVETLRLILVDADAYDLSSPTTFTLTIDDGDLPQLSFARASDSIAEGADITVTVNVSPSPITALTVSVATSGAALNDVTFTGLTGSGSTRSLTVPASSPSATFTIRATDDPTPGEADRQLQLSLRAGTGYGVSSASSNYRLTIQDDDYSLRFVRATNTVMENAGTVQISLSAAQQPANAARRSGFVARVRVHGDATAGTDYTIPSSTDPCPITGIYSRARWCPVAGQDGVYDVPVVASGAATLSLNLLDAEGVDDPRTIELTLLSRPDGRYTPGGGSTTHVLTIEDDDGVVVKFDAPSANRGNEGANITMRILVEGGAPSSPLPVNLCVASTSSGITTTDYSISGLTAVTGSQACGGSTLLQRGALSIPRNADETRIHHYSA